MMEVFVLRAPERLLLILNNPPDNAVHSVYDRKGNIFRRFEIGPSQLVQRGFYKLENQSFQHYLRLDEMDARLPDKIMIRKQRFLAIQTSI